MMTQKRPEEREPPLAIFCSYAHKDEVLRDELATHLISLRRRGLLNVWHDRKIAPGSDWAKEIDDHLEEASIILLLISPDFLASDYCYGIEMHRALEKHQNGTARVIPIILRPTYWQEEPLGSLQALPRNATPIVSWSSRDEAFLDVVRGIREVVNQMHRRSPFVLQQNTSSREKQRSIETLPNRDTWADGGALGERVGSLARKNLWAQAEATARQIPSSQKKSLILHKLVNAMMQAEQWERARGIAFSIEDPSHKREALAQLAERLIEMKQWERAKAVTYAIDHFSDRSRLLNQLSQAIESDERLGYQSQFIAYDSDITGYTAGPPCIPYTGSGSTIPYVGERSRSSRKGWLLLAAVLLVAIALLLFLVLGKYL